jgi:hypothetical protein
MEYNSIHREMSAWLDKKDRPSWNADVLSKDST